MAAEMIDRDSLIASIVGACTGGFFLKKDTIPRRAGMVLGGIGLSIVFSPLLATILPSITLVGAGGAISLFGMAIISKLYELIDAINPKEFLAKLYKRIGLGD